jgi:hypothetical protein
MIKINGPLRTAPLEKTGQVLLRYQGDNLHNWNIRAFKTAKFMFKQLKSIKKDTQKNITFFSLIFDEYFGEELTLNFQNRICFHNKNEIGTIEHFEIFLTDSHLFISGSYNHESITLAYYNENLSNFDFVTEISQKEATLLRGIWKKDEDILTQLKLW